MATSTDGSLVRQVVDDMAAFLNLPPALSDTDKLVMAHDILTEILGDLTRDTASEEEEIAACRRMLARVAEAQSALRPN